MQLPHYLGLLHQAQGTLARSFREVGGAHADEPDVQRACQRLAAQCDRHVSELAPFVERYGEHAHDEPERLHSDLFRGPRTGPLALVRDLHDLYLMVTECDISWTVVGQAAQGLRDEALVAAVGACEGETSAQLAWLRTRIKAAAPQSLVVA
jgi:hypothetical protein